MKLALLNWRRGRSVPGRLGISLSTAGLTVACINGDGLLSHCENLPANNPKALADLVEANGWQGMSASVVLQSLEYQLLLAGAPPVSEAEMSQAVRWKIRDMIDHSLDEAAVDSFRIPDDAYRGRQKMLYVAAMKKSRLHELVDPLEECALVTMFPLGWCLDHGSVIERNHAQISLDCCR